MDTMTRTKIGNKVDAKIAYRIFSDHMPMPEGWSKLGEGCSRVAYLSPKGVVYKVTGSMGLNKDEEHNILKYRAMLLPLGVHMPKAYVHTLDIKVELDQWGYAKNGAASPEVIAMELVPQPPVPRQCSKWVCSWDASMTRECDCGKPDGRCVDDVRKQIMTATKNRISDLHYGNLIAHTDGRYFLIDVA